MTTWPWKSSLQSMWNGHPQNIWKIKIRADLSICSFAVKHKVTVSFPFESQRKSWNCKSSKLENWIFLIWERCMQYNAKYILAEHRIKQLFAVIKKIPLKVVIKGLLSLKPSFLDCYFVLQKTHFYPFISSSLVWQSILATAVITSKQP